MSDTEWEAVGTVQVLHPRNYALDPNGPSGVPGTEVMVDPGVFTVYRKADAYCWLMRGRINERIDKIGDGLFVMNDGDKATGLEVQFPSMTFGVEQFEEFLTEDIAKPGPLQRLRFDLREATS